MKLSPSTITLYRGITSKNLPPRYPGTYYTESKDLATWYAREGGTVRSITFSPKKVFSIDKLITNKTFRNEIENKFKEFFKEHASIEDTQLYDNLYNNITDFSFPTKDDNKFLKSLGYDSVYFSHEGGQRVDSWYIF